MEEFSEKQKNNDLPIVFVVARGRSGTTLLQIMLDSHPEIIAPFESRFVVHFHNKYGSIQNWTPKIKNAFIKDVLKEDRIYFFWRIDEEKLRKNIYNLPQQTTYGKVCKQVYAAFVSMHPKAAPKVIIDKNPVHTFLLQQINGIYPNAKYIHLVRDYRASASSMHQIKKNKGIRESGYRWILENMEIEKLKAKNPERFITLRYEDLLENPQQRLSKLCDFLGLPYHENMLTYHERASKVFRHYIEESPTEEIRYLRETVSKTVHKNISKPINPTFINKWKEKLNEAQVQFLDEICGKFAALYGYETLKGKAKETKIPADIQFIRKKIKLYYRLPIWLRELKSKPDLALLPDEKK